LYHIVLDVVQKINVMNVIVSHVQENNVIVLMDIFYKMMEIVDNVTQNVINVQYQNQIVKNVWIQVKFYLIVLSVSLDIILELVINVF
jgi:hypothetical protein